MSNENYEFFEFPTISQYLDELKENKNLAVVSMSMAAEMRNTTRAGIERMIQMEKISWAKIGKTRCVLAKSLIEAKDKYDEEIATVRKVLEEHATRGEKVFYEQVMTPIGLRTNVPAHRTKIGQILGDISHQTFNEPNEKNTPILLSVLVHKKTAGRTLPSEGFFNLVESLNEHYGCAYDYDDRNSFVEEQMGYVFNLYGKNNNKPKKVKRLKIVTNTD